MWHASAALAARVRSDGIYLDPRLRLFSRTYWRCAASPRGSSSLRRWLTATELHLCDMVGCAGIAVPWDACTACLEGRFKQNNGPTECESCPIHSTTEGTGATGCLCDAGYTDATRLLQDALTSGTVTMSAQSQAQAEARARAHPCAACAVDTWKTARGPAVCLPCPANSTTSRTTVQGSTSRADCVCDSANGWEGDLGRPGDICTQTTSWTTLLPNLLHSWVLLFVVGTVGVLIIVACVSASHQKRRSSKQERSQRAQQQNRPPGSAELSQLVNGKALRRAQVVDL